METIDVSGLPHNKVAYLNQLIEQWRREGEPTEATPRSQQDEPLHFTTQQSRVIGPLTRREIYEDA